MRKVLMATAVIIAVALIVTLLSLHVGRDFSWEITPQDMEYEDTLIVAADKDYPPYSFIDAQGSYAGHDVEMIYALGEELGVNIDLRLMNWSDALAGLETGSVDVLTGVTYSPQRLSTMLFTTPIIYEPYVAFGAPEKDFTLDRLTASRLCTIAGDSVNAAFIIPYGLEENTAYYDTYSECFLSVASGENDYVLAPYLTGTKIVDDNGFKSIEAVGPSLNNSIFCLAVQADNEALRDRLNEAVGQLFSSGAMADINDRWLVKYVQKTSLIDIIRANLQSSIIAVLLLALLLLGVYYLIERKSNRKLFIQTERARIFEETVDDPLLEYHIQKDKYEYSYKRQDGSLRKISFTNYLTERKFEKHVGPESWEAFQHLLRGRGFVDSRATLECRAMLFKSEWEWCRIRLRSIEDMSGTAVGVVGRIENINKDVLEREKNRKLASRDRLTGLFNRETFLERVEARLKKNQGNYAFIMLDYDNFKMTNDTWGHAVGDEMLIHMAATLNRILDADDLIARFGGDEFMVFMECENKETVSRKMEQLNLLLAQTPKGENAAISCSIGIVFTDDRSLSVQCLMERADQAMYRAKQAGKHRSEFWEG